MRRSRPISREDAIKYLDKTHPVYRFLTVFRSKPVMAITGITIFVFMVGVLAIISGLLFHFKDWLILELNFAPVVSNILTVFPLAFIIAFLWLYLTVSPIIILLQFMFDLAEKHRLRQIKRLQPEAIDPDLLEQILNIELPYYSNFTRDYDFITCCNRADNLPVLYEYAKNPNHPARTHALTAICNYNSPEAISMMLERLQANPGGAPGVLIDRLTELNIREVIPLLEQSLDLIQHPYRRKRIKAALERFKEPSETATS